MYSIVRVFYSCLYHILEAQHIFLGEVRATLLSIFISSTQMTLQTETMSEHEN